MSDLMYSQFFLHVVHNGFTSIFFLHKKSPNIQIKIDTDYVCILEGRGKEKIITSMLCACAETKNENNYLCICIKIQTYHQNIQSISQSGVDFERIQNKLFLTKYSFIVYLL